MPAGRPKHRCLLRQQQLCMRMHSLGRIGMQGVDLAPQANYLAPNAAYAQGLPLSTVSTSGERQTANGAKLSNLEPILYCDSCAPRYS